MKMKKRILIIAAVFAAVSCNNPDQQTTTGNSVDSTSNMGSSEVVIDTMPPETADTTHQH
jgi:hypothetical protein